MKNKLSISQRKKLTSVEAYFHTKSIREGWEDKFVAMYNKKKMEGENNGEDA